MIKILISSCLLGEPVKYNGGSNRVNSVLLDKWLAEQRLVPVCPEVAGGLPIPRNPVEIQQGTGKEVLDRIMSAVDCCGLDYSEQFIAGAESALETAKKHTIQIAILKEGSPSCGTHLIYSGNFDGSKKPGKGVTASLLEQHGIATFSETQLQEVADLLAQIDSSSPHCSLKSNSG